VGDFVALGMKHVGRAVPYVDALCTLSLLDNLVERGKSSGQTVYLDDSSAAPYAKASGTWRAGSPSDRGRQFYCCELGECFLSEREQRQLKSATVRKSSRISGHEFRSIESWPATDRVQQIRGESEVEHLLDEDAEHRFARRWIRRAIQ
jgi:hypothetical protein